MQLHVNKQWNKCIISNGHSKDIRINPTPTLLMGNRGKNLAESVVLSWSWLLPVEFTVVQY